MAKSDRPKSIAAGFFMKAKITILAALFIVGCSVSAPASPPAPPSGLTITVQGQSDES
jgi:hypothetical protein